MDLFNAMYNAFQLVTVFLIIVAAVVVLSILLKGLGAGSGGISDEPVSYEPEPVTSIQSTKCDYCGSALTFEMLEKRAAEVSHGRQILRVMSLHCPNCGAPTEWNFK